jgi:hypothetical protein
MVSNTTQGVACIRGTEMVEFMLPLFYGLVVPSFAIYGIAENL